MLHTYGPSVNQENVGCGVTSRYISPELDTTMQKRISSDELGGD